MKKICRSLDSLGRIVIPKDMRKALKIDINSEICLSLVDDKIIITNSAFGDSKEKFERIMDSKGLNYDDVIKMIEK